MSETNQPIPPHHKDLIAKAIMEIDDNVAGLGHGPSYEDVAEESGCDIAVVKQYVDEELVPQGIARHGSLAGGDDEFVLDDTKGKRWRKRLGI